VGVLARVNGIEVHIMQVAGYVALLGVRLFEVLVLIVVADSPKEEPDGQRANGVDPLEELLPRKPSASEGTVDVVRHAEELGAGRHTSGEASEHTSVAMEDRDERPGHQKNLFAPRHIGRRCRHAAQERVHHDRCQLVTICDIPIKGHDAAIQAVGDAAHRQGFETLLLHQINASIDDALQREHRPIATPTPDSRRPPREATLTTELNPLGRTHSSHRTFIAPPSASSCQRRALRSSWRFRTDNGAGLIGGAVGEHLWRRNDGPRTKARRDAVSRIIESCRAICDHPKPRRHASRVMSRVCEPDAMVSGNDPRLFYADIEALDQFEPWNEASATARLDRISTQLPVDRSKGLEFVESNNNDVWKIGDLYLRVAWRGDRSRLTREAALMEALAGVVPVPEVVAVGGDNSLSWSISRAAPGRLLGDLCTPPFPSELRGVMANLAEVLRDLHSWSPPPNLLDLLTNRPGQDATDPMAIVGADTVPLPIPRALALVEPLKMLQYVDPAVVDAAAERMSELADVDLKPTEHIIHGDVYVGNVLVLGGRVSALLDFEFARLGPADLELISLVRAIDAERRLGITRPPLLDWLQQDYPDLFAAPDLDRRLWLYALAFTLRHILFYPPDAPEDAGLEPSHPVHTLRRLVDGPIDR
jgi:hygromycin-B 7''-O-kinase